jgi:signal peptidase I
MVKRTRRTLEILLAAFVLLVLGLGVAVQLAPAAGYGMYAVRSASMAPAIRVGDLVLEERVDAASIRVGDVITLATATGVTVTHRVESVTPNDAGPVFTTRGDANASPDPVATFARQVRGRVTWDVPLLGYLLAMVTTPTGLLALLSIGAMLLTAIWILGEHEARRENELLDQMARELGIPRPVTS